MSTITHIVQISLDIEQVELFNRFTLPSLLNQTFQDFKIFLICDNKYRQIAEKKKWNKRITLCYGTDNEEFLKFDSDHVAITKLDVGDLFHQEAMSNIKDAVVRHALLFDKGECLIFHNYLCWDRVNQFIYSVCHELPSPFTTHIVPKKIYKNRKEFTKPYFVSHSLEAPSDIACIIKHEQDPLQVKKRQKNEEDIFRKKDMEVILRNFSVRAELVEGDKGERGEFSSREQIDIIFITHNHSKMSRRCLENLKKHTKAPFRLIWIDNGSMGEEHRAIREKVEEFPHIYYRFDVNRFYARAINQGLIMARSRYVALLSNDVYVSSGWLTKLLTLSDRDQEIGLISPLTDNIGSDAPRANLAIERFNLPINGQSFSHINNLEARFGRVDANISMFCTVLNMEVVNKIGLLDERFFILGNDDDYCDRIRLAGFRTGVALNCFVRHEHGTTKNDVFPVNSRETLAIKRDHQALLREKRQIRKMTGRLD